MSFDLEKFQSVAELGEVIRLQNEAMDRLQQFRKSRPNLIMPNLAKMVEENMKENVQVLYKELNNLHKPAAQQTRYICDDCHMAFLVKLPGGICDECRARQATKPREYVVNTTPHDPNAQDEDEAAAQAALAASTAQDEDAAEADDATEAAAAGENEGTEPGQAAAAPADDFAQMDPSDIEAETTDISVIANSEGAPLEEESAGQIAADAEHAATGDKLPIEEEAAISEEPPADVSGAVSEIITETNAAAQGDEAAQEDLSDGFRRFMEMAGTEDFQSGVKDDKGKRTEDAPQTQGDIFSETDLHTSETPKSPASAQPSEKTLSE